MLGSIRLLVICSNRENYFELFKDRVIDGRVVEVDQTPWRDMIGTVSFSDSLVVRIRPQQDPFPGTVQEKARSFIPDVVLLRSFVLGSPGHDWRHLFRAFQHYNVATVNSLRSYEFSVEKEIMWGHLRRVRALCPTLPLIAQTYYSGSSVASFTEGFPLVCKVGSASQGIGKSRVLDNSQWKDQCSLLAMMPLQGFTSEPLVDWHSDVRIQRIGKHFRAIRRFKTSGDAWKANDAYGIDEQGCEVEERWKVWCNVIAENLDMNIIGLDLLVDKNGREFILEVNGSSIGFSVHHREEDIGHIVEVVAERLSEVARERNAAFRARVFCASVQELVQAAEYSIHKRLAAEILKRISLEENLTLALRLLEPPKGLKGLSEHLSAQLLLVWILTYRVAMPVLGAGEAFVVDTIQARLIKSLREDESLDSTSASNAVEFAVECRLISRNPSLLTQIQQKGYARIPNFLSSAECDEIEAVFDELTFGPLTDEDLRHRLGRDYGDQSQERDTPVPQYRIINVNSPSRYDERAAGTVFEKKCREQVLKLLGEDYDLDYSQFLTKLPGKKGAVFPMHQDQNYWPKKASSLTPTTTLTFSLALSDAGENHGCLQVLPGSHLSKTCLELKEIPGKRAVVLASESGDDSIPLPVKRGDVTIHEEYIVHGSGGNSMHTPRKTIVVAFRHEQMVAYERSVGYSHSYNDDPAVIEAARRGHV